MSLVGIIFLSRGLFEEGCFIDINQVFHVSHSLESHSNLRFTAKAIYDSLKRCRIFSLFHSPDVKVISAISWFSSVWSKHALQFTFLLN